MRHAIILVGVLVAAPASAGHSREAGETSSASQVAPEPAPLASDEAVIRIGDLVDGARRRTVERVDARVRVRRSVVVVELAIGVRGTRPARGDESVHQGVIELDIPAGVNATGLALTEGGTRVEGELMFAERARGIYDRALTPEARDPALLEWTRTADDREVLTLRVAPLTEAGATATVTLEIPRGTTGGRVVLRANAPSAVELSADDNATDRLAIEGRRVRRQRGDGTTVLVATARRGRAPIIAAYGAIGALATRDPDGAPPPSAAFLGPSLSLVAAPPPPEPRGRREAPRCTLSVGQPAVRPTRSSTGLRATIRAYLPRARHCFQQAAQRDRTTSEGTITASWTITESGAVEDVGVAGFGNAALDACVASVVETMAFGTSGDGESRVNYPFTFVLAQPVTSR